MNTTVRYELGTTEVGQSSDEESVFAEIAADENETLPVGRPTHIGVITYFILADDERYRSGFIGIELIELLSILTLWTERRKDDSVPLGMPGEVGHYVCW